MATTNPKAAFIAWATTAGTSLYTLVGARIQQDLLPAGFNNSQAAITVNQQSGSPDPYDVNLKTCLLTCKCYGGSDLQIDADNVAEALIARCHRIFNQIGTYGRIVRMLCVSKFDSADPVEGWPVVTVLVEITVA